MRILFVCLGNICRSPMAEGILKKKLAERNVDAVVESAGFESFHINEPPDKRAVKIAKKNGIDITESRSRLFTSDDFDKFDRIFIMESSNNRDIKYFTRNEDDLKKVKYLMSVVHGKNEAVPDPYFGDEKGFEKTFQTLDKACTTIADKLKNKEEI
ncbi:MAG: low molecular weight phosphotyrosine protein phosphatase [Bacteroidales bacterium]|nr:low molecular weight phosphotyrosine protein phosphatase [Bacteroidales bacterium]MCF8396911.1 low molecular weight phosphotyrosine protein phosphatase [Bacteroidales bacterium]